MEFYDRESPSRRRFGEWHSSVVFEVDSREKFAVFTSADGIAERDARFGKELSPLYNLKQGSPKTFLRALKDFLL